MSEATPRPWKVSKSDWDGTDYWEITTADGVEVCMAPTDFYAYHEGPFIAPDDNEADAALIVRAVNCHDELVEACKALVEWIAGVKDLGVGSPSDRFSEAQCQGIITALMDCQPRGFSLAAARATIATAGPDDDTVALYWH